VGSCEHRKEPSGSIKAEKFHDQLEVSISFSGTLLHGVRVLFVNSLCAFLPQCFIILLDDIASFYL
jgi:hypothetical protein